MSVKARVKRWLKRRAYASGVRINRVDDLDPFEPLLYKALKKKGSLFIVQIGANDGVLFDPIYDFVTAHPDAVSGLALEPLPDFFARLKANYAHCPRFVPLNVAIHNTAKEMTIWRVKPEAVPKGKEGLHGTASFNPEHYKLSGLSAADVTPEKVRCLTFAELMSEHRVQHVDVLQIDTEGYDFEILKALDLTTLRPTIIHFEHGLDAGIMTLDQLRELTERFHQAGYTLFLSQFDGTAFDPLLGIP